MTCRDFQLKWNELLDAERCSSSAEGDTLAGSTELDYGLSDDSTERTLASHAAECEACQQFAVRCRVLRRALRAWPSVPAASANLADRIMAAAATSLVAVRPVLARRRAGIWASLAGAAAVAAAVAVALPQIRMPVAPDHVRRGAAEQPSKLLKSERDRSEGSHVALRTGDRLAFHDVVATATSATWDLALSASEPAARISRDVLDATNPEGQTSSDSSADRVPAGGGELGGEGGLEAPGFPVPMPGFTPIDSDPAAAGAAFLGLGDRLAAGVRPLSRTARHAFSFLFGPSPDPSGPRSSRPAAKGA
jgi:hypothetical protein